MVINQKSNSLSFFPFILHRPPYPICPPLFPFYLPICPPTLSHLPTFLHPMPLLSWNYPLIVCNDIICHPSRNPCNQIIDLSLAMCVRLAICWSAFGWNTREIHSGFLGAKSREPSFLFVLFILEAFWNKIDMNGHPPWAMEPWLWGSKVPYESWVWTY